LDVHVLAHGHSTAPTGQVSRRTPKKENHVIKKTFKIPDMTCSNCAMKLESLEDDLDGVKEINASYHRLEMVIEFDESKLTDEQIVAAVKKKGYQAVAA
jgi:copper chaperone